MSYKAIILGHPGEPLNENLLKKLETVVREAVEDFDVSDFYFANEEEPDYDEFSNKYLTELAHNRAKVNEIIALKIREYRSAHKAADIRSAIIAARMTDANYNATLYDEVIQGFTIYYNLLENVESLEAYTFRDEFLGKHVDYVFWYSNRILISASTICSFAQTSGARIITID